MNDITSSRRVVEAQFVMTTYYLFPLLIQKCFLCPHSTSANLKSVIIPTPTGCWVKASTSTYLEEEFNIILLLSRGYLIFLSCTSPRGIFHIAIPELFERMN